MIYGYSGVVYEERLILLNRYPLEKRRTSWYLIDLFKFVNGDMEALSLVSDSRILEGLK